MTDLLEQRNSRTNRLQRSNRASAALSPPPLEEPKELFAEIRSMVADEDFSPNLSRAVVQFVRHCDLKQSEDEAGEFDESSDDWITSNLWSGSFASLWEISRANAPLNTKRRSFLDHARRLDEHGQTDFALDLIFDQIDEMLLAGQFDRVDQLLKDTMTNDYSVEVLLGTLTATLPAKAKLPGRVDFFQRAKQTLESRGEPYDSLLVGLE